MIKTADGLKVYVVTNTGITAETPPSHTTGSALNGTATLQYINHTDANGSGATAEATVLDGAVIDIVLTHRGIGYTSNPSVTIIGGGGAAADAHAIVTIAASGTQKLEDTVFYVITDEFNVYQCLDNNFSSPSTIKPTGTSSELLTTSDGYIWKFLFAIPIALRNKFLTDQYMPVVTALRDQFYSAGSLKTVRIDQAGSGYTSGSITIQGDGYATGEQLWLTNHTMANGGSGYIDATISIDPPYSGVSPWLPRQTVLVGQRLSYLNNVYQVEVSGLTGPTASVWTANTTVTTGDHLYYADRLYTVTNSGTTSSSAPAHTSGSATNGTATLYYAGTTNSVGPVHRKGSVSSGTSILKYIGTTATAEPIIVDGVITDITLYGMMKRIQVTNGGSGYTSPPTVTFNGGGGSSAAAIAVLNENGAVTRIDITDPGYDYIDMPDIVIGTQWTASTVVNIGDQIFYSNRLYTVSGSGTTSSSTAPIHVTGSAANGTSTLDYVGVAAEAEGTIKYGSGYSSYPSVTVASITGTDCSILFTGQKTEATILPIFANDTLGQQWEATTAYSAGLKVWYSNRLYTCTTAGTSGVNPPSHNAGTYLNGTARFLFEGYFGQLIALQIDDPGEGYTYANLNVTGDGIGAQVSADLSPGDVTTLQANIELLTVDGKIINCPVISGGYGYGAATATINGDGSGATATVRCSNGAVEKIIITNSGSGYRWATITINGVGYGAKARAIIGPYGGFGKDALNNLYSRTLMFYSNVSQDKNQGFDVNNDYRQLGILKSPRNFSNNRPLSSVLASACWVISGVANTTLFPADSIIYRTDNGNRFRIVTNNGAALLVQALDNGLIVSGLNFVNNNGDVFSASAVTAPTIDKYSGDILFIDNKQAFTPTADETVTLRTVIKF
jgi:hypothetical protein